MSIDQKSLKAFFHPPLQIYMLTAFLVALSQFSLLFSRKYKVIRKESMEIDQKSLKAFFHAPLQLFLICS